MGKGEYYPAMMVGTQSPALVSPNSRKVCAIEHKERAFIFYLDNYPHFALGMCTASPERMGDMVFNWMVNDQMPPLDKVLWFH